MSVRQAQAGGAAAGSALSSAGAGAKELLEKTIREVFEGFPRGLRGSSRRGIPELSAYVETWVFDVWYDDSENMVRASSLAVGFTDRMVNEKTGKLEEYVVARVEFITCPAERSVRRVELYTIHAPPVTWRPPRALTLLPVAFNAALSVSGASEVLERKHGLRLGARGVSVRHMYSADDLKRRPVMLVDFDVNGKRLPLNKLVMIFKRGVDTWEARILLRHGDRKLAMRLYMLAWLKRELGKALKKLSEEKGYGYEETPIYRVRLGDKEVGIVPLELPPWASVHFFDGEYLVTSIYKEGHRGEDLAGKLEEKAGEKLEDIERASRGKLAELVEKTRGLLSSEDFRERDLGILLAVLIKRAYEEAEMAIPG
jgi:hypothetical protein